MSRRILPVHGSAEQGIDAGQRRFVFTSRAGRRFIPVQQGAHNAREGMAQGAANSRARQGQGDVGLIGMRDQGQNIDSVAIKRRFRHQRAQRMPLNQQR